MKLAEALSLRSDMQTRLDGLQQRILRNLKVQEGDTPHEDPKQLLPEMQRLYEELTALVQQINRRNNETMMPDGENTLADALAARDVLSRQRNALAAVAGRASENDMRLTHTEVKTYTTVSVADLQREVDDLSRRHRELDTQIQSLNWTTTL